MRDRPLIGEPLERLRARLDESIGAGGRLRPDSGWHWSWSSSGPARSPNTASSPRSRSRPAPGSGSAVGLARGATRCRGTIRRRLAFARRAQTCALCPRPMRSAAMVLNAESPRDSGGSPCPGAGPWLCAPSAGWHHAARQFPNRKITSMGAVLMASSHLCGFSPLTFVRADAPRTRRCRVH